VRSTGAAAIYGGWQDFWCSIPLEIIRPEFPADLTPLSSKAKAGIALRKQVKHQKPQFNFGLRHDMQLSLTC
jgi:hypothetical protein